VSAEVVPEVTCMQHICSIAADCNITGTAAVHDDMTCYEIRCILYFLT